MHTSSRTLCTPSLPPMATKETFSSFLEKFESCQYPSFKIVPVHKKGNEQESWVSFHFAYFLQHNRKGYPHPNLWKERENIKTVQLQTWMAIPSLTKQQLDYILCEWSAKCPRICFIVTCMLMILFYYVDISPLNMWYIPFKHVIFQKLNLIRF